MNNVTDAELVLLVVENDDRDAFAELMQRHKDAMYSLLYRTLGRHRELAEDIAQNVFIAVYRGLRSFKKESKFSTWLYRVTVNQAYTALRRVKKQEVSWQQNDGENSLALEERLVDEKALNPLKEMIGKQVWQAVDRLPPQSRAVIDMYYSKELSYQEMAEVLSLPIGTIKTHLYRGKAQLRELLTESGQENGK